MLTRKKVRRRFAWIGILCLLVSLVPNGFIAPRAEAAGGDLEVTFGSGTHIGNLSYAADNAFINFNTGQPGFVKTEGEGGIIGWATGDLLPSGDNGAYIDYDIKVADNPTLLALAESNEAKVTVGWDEVDYNEFGCVFGICKTRVSDVTITVDDASIDGHGRGSTTGHKEMTVPLTPDTVIHIGAAIEGQGAGVKGMFIKFKDEVRPVLTDYTFTGNGEEWPNTKINQEELYVKKGENLTFSYNFSEPVRPTAVVAGNADPFLRHPLFVNPDGTGLPAAGQQQYLTNQTYNTGNLKTLHSSVVYRYTGTQYHNSGNNPLTPRIKIDPAEDTSFDPPMNQPLEQKFKDAVFADAAGNVAITTFTGKLNAASNNYLAGKTLKDPFDFDNGGYRVIVDAVPPKYVKVGNGIQPQILTGVSLNNKDEFDFTVQFSEAAVVRRGWNASETFLLLNNGMKAYYKPPGASTDYGNGTDKWMFHLQVPEGAEAEVPLLKVIALTNDAAPTDPATNEPADTNVLQDYAGNLLIEPANYDGVWPADESADDRANVNSTIDWAGLSIDNTPPQIGFRYGSGGADSERYAKNGTVTIDANDPDLTVPRLDPDEPGATRPSKGIYHPSNMTGSASPAVGLVYYLWSRSAEDPFKDVASDHFAALKRYSLKAKQPREDLYPDDGKFADLNLASANNKTNLIPLPPEALAPDNSGEWYLHVWTADMTWDSARELMQQQKKESYIEEHPDTYQDWLDKAPGESEADKQFYADNQALAAVGDYGDLNVWPLDDFKQDDSNWTHAVAVVKVDNLPPAVSFDGKTGDNTSAVQLKVTVQDPHSGVRTAQYQWVKEGDEPQEINWQTLPLEGNTATLSTRGDVIEDGSYALYVRTGDNAGNDRTVRSETVTVNSAGAVTGSFSPDPEAGRYVQSYGVVFKLGGSLLSVAGATYADGGEGDDGMSVVGTTYSDAAEGNGELSVTDTTYTGNGGMSVSGTTYSDALRFVGYAFSDSPVRPGDGAFIQLAPDLQDEDGTLNYVIPANAALNGKVYLFTMAQMDEDGVMKKYYFSQAYYFDNLPPQVAFGKTRSDYPQPSQEIDVAIHDNFNGAGAVVQYQFVREGDAPPDEGSTGWTDLDSDGTAKIGNEQLQPGESQKYMLYVLARDAAGNVGVAQAGPFNISREADDIPPSSVSAGLVYLYGDDEDGYTAIVKLDLGVEDKTGYEYSISPDGGTSWVKWSPYTNFVALKVPTNDPAGLQIQVKFRTPGGAIGDPAPLDTSGDITQEPVYALASLSSTTPVTSDRGVDIVVTAPLGIKVTPAEVNPQTPIRSGNTFTVNRDGVYAFDLTDMADSDRTDTLYVSVANIDDEKPYGTIRYLTTGPTNGNVTVQLTDLSEPVKILNNGGSATHTFTDNGSFTFEIADEAGNINDEITAKVDYIHRDPPRAKVVRSYATGEGGGKTFGTITDANGNVLYSSGVTLTVVKADEAAEDITVAGGQDTVTLTKNGTATFIVSDSYGNTSVVKETVDNIISQGPVADSVTYTFVDDAGNPLPESAIKTIGGKKYAKGKVKVTVSGKTGTPNRVFAGTAPIADEENGGYTNLISGEDGSFSYSRTYSADGSTYIALSDAVGNVSRVNVDVQGLDNTPPSIELNSPAVGIVRQDLSALGLAAGGSEGEFVVTNEQAKKLGLGGFAATDNVSAAGHVRVSISGLSMGDDVLGKPQSVTYTAVDEAGNTAVAYQNVTVVAGDGMNIFANGMLISGSSATSAIFDRNSLTFNITNYNVMDVNGQKLTNEQGTYDLLYVSGLYREGQLKYIATDISYSELVNSSFKVTFPDTGWYTIIVRNQEREREFATFFISKKN